MTLEIVKWQTQEPAEDMQVQFGVQPGADDVDDQPSGVTEERLVNEQDGDYGRQQHEGRNAVELQHLVDQRHDDERRQNGKDAERERGYTDVTHGTAFLPYQVDQPAKGERRIGRDVGSRRTQQHRLTRPHLRQAQLVDGDGFVIVWPAG